VGAADVEDPAVGSDREAVRLTAVLEIAARRADDPLALVVGRDRGLAAAADHARRPLDGAQQVRPEVRLVEAGGGAAHAGVEGAAALEVAAPGDRVVGAADVRAVTGGSAGRAVAGQCV